MTSGHFASRSASPSETSRKTVLVIEDEPKMATIVSRALSAVGYAVASAGSGYAGLEALQASPYDLVLLDLLLPDLDGFALLGRAAEQMPGQPILVLSALDDVRTKVMCLELGACDYLTKPFEIPELLARVRLRTRDGIGARLRRRLTRGRYALDLQRRVLEHDDRAVPLTTREFVLLEYLMERAGETCSRGELLENVWGYSFDPGTNVVDVCVGRLRHKLGDHCLITVRNVGYSFVGT
jgi:two-component system, OmpR family, response regulator